MGNTQAPKRHQLSIFVLAMMNVAVIMSLRGLPLMAKEGLSMFFYLIFAGLVFLIPTSLVSAELATGWPEGGGVYKWVKEAFGGRCGFIAIWLQWIQNVIWYPTVLAFAGGALAYLFLDPGLAQTKVYTVVVILGVYWGATFLNFRGMKTSGWMTTAGVLGGTLFPAVLIITLGVIWWLTGKPLAFMDGSHKMLPDFGNFDNVSFLAGIVLLFAGMEVSAVHAREVRNPKTDYPKAIFFSAAIILVVFTLGSLAVAAVIPSIDISLTAGIMQGFSDLLNKFGIGWMLPVMGFLVAFGAMGGVIAWIVGPSKGLFATASEGDLPPFLQHVNKNGVPTHILLVQGVVVTTISMLYLFMPNVSSAFFLLTALTAILYLVMYVLLFAAGIRLRYSQPNVERAYRVPGGNAGMWAISGLGLVGALFAIVVGFFPPDQLKVGSPAFYVGFLAVGTLIFVVVPIIIYQFRKPGWVTRKEI